MTPIKIDYDSYCEVTRESTEDEWDADDTSTSHSIKKAYIVNDNSFNCVGNFEAKKGDTIYLVCVVYSTGNSFGREEGSGIEFIQAFLSQEKAERCSKQIEAHAELYQEVEHAELYQEVNGYSINDVRLKELSEKCLNLAKELDFAAFYSVSFQDEQDQIQKTTAPWNGYFESVDMIEVVGLSLKLENKMKNRM